MPIINCIMCGKERKVPPSYIKRGAKCCSLKCHAKWCSKERSGINSPNFIDGGKVEAKCKFCGDIFMANKKRAKIGKGVFCSHSCAFKYLYQDKQKDNHPMWKGGQIGSSKRYQKKHPEKLKAWRKLNRALKSGRVVRLSCEVCGSAKTQGHHDDYNKPLDVRWLCVKHHNALHRKLNPWTPKGRINK